MNTENGIASIVGTAFAELRRTFDSLLTATAQPGKAAALPVRSPRTDDRLFLACYSNATATIRDGIDGRRHFVISGELNDFNARKNGSFRSIYQTKVFSTADLTDYPEPLPFGDF